MLAGHEKKIKSAPQARAARRRRAGGARGARGARRRRAERRGAALGALSRYPFCATFQFSAVGGAIIRDYGRIIMIGNRFRASGARSDTSYCRLKEKKAYRFAVVEIESREPARLPKLANSRLHHHPGSTRHASTPSSKVSEITLSTKS